MPQKSGKTEAFSDIEAIRASVREARTEDGAALPDLRQQAKDLDEEQATLLQKALEAPGSYDGQLKTLMDEKRP